jgi:hypothetical protein
MGLVYRLLGVVAWVGRGLSSWRLNYVVPLHWVVVIASAGAALRAAETAHDGFINGQSPTTLPLKEVIGRKDLIGRYVSVSGALIPEGSQTFVTRRGGGGETVDAVYVPFVTEEKSSPILFVKYTKAPPEGAARKATVAGMLRAPDALLREKAAEINKRFAPSGVDLTNLLDAEGRPAQPWPFVALSITGGLLCGMMLWTRFTKWTVYRRLDGAAPGSVSAAPGVGEFPGLDVRVTGSFTRQATAGLARGAPMRVSRLLVGCVRAAGSALFVQDAPARTVITPAGELAFETMGVDGKAAVPFRIVIKPDGIKSWDRGLLYYAFGAHPAVRLRFTDGSSGRESVAFVTAADDARLESFLGVVTRTPGYALVYGLPNPDSER